ncbi:DUF3299 domain-containing protein [Chachezhania sediminis]|uniref:DUF3299 domain-containing protein n=1 Tax=Chachezhania sediminis TaxID=2599291 RepID=UPI00131D97C8|nr:DUF3299 domain-containing protein [Chachezhania sediminis]
MTKTFNLNRRHFTWLAAAGLAAPAMAVPRAARAEDYREVTWEDLIPPGVPYAQIIGEGYMDEENDVWAPVYDENAVKLNQGLDGALIKMPGYVVPVDMDSDGVHTLVLVPYEGACIHVPPPPPNQLVFVNTKTPLSEDDIWGAIWVWGRLHAKLRETDLAAIGYELEADRIEVYEM